jgi:hypothetical protein
MKFDRFYASTRDWQISGYSDDIPGRDLLTDEFELALENPRNTREILHAGRPRLVKSPYRNVLLKGMSRAMLLPGPPLGAGCLASSPSLGRAISSCFSVRSGCDRLSPLGVILQSWMVRIGSRN